MFEFLFFENGKIIINCLQHYQFRLEHVYDIYM